MIFLTPQISLALSPQGFSRQVTAAPAKPFPACGMVKAQALCGDLRVSQLARVRNQSPE